MLGKKEKILLEDLDRWWNGLSLDKKYEVYNCDICHK